MFMGFKFDPKLAKDININDVVEQQPLPQAALCSMNYDEDKEDTEQLLLAASQAYKENVAIEPSQQGEMVTGIIQEKNLRNPPRKYHLKVLFPPEFASQFILTKPTS